MLLTLINPVLPFGSLGSIHAAKIWTRMKERLHTNGPELLMDPTMPPESTVRIPEPLSHLRQQPPKSSPERCSRVPCRAPSVHPTILPRSLVHALSWTALRFNEHDVPSQPSSSIVSPNSVTINTTAITTHPLDTRESRSSWNSKTLGSLVFPTSS